MPEVGKDGRARGVLAGVDGQPELDLGVDGVEPGVLQRVGLELGDQADAAALVAAQVDDHAALGRDPLQRALELRAAVAALRAEDVAGEALRVQPDQGRTAPQAPRADQGEVLGRR